MVRSTYACQAYLNTLKAFTQTISYFRPMGTYGWAPEPLWATVCFIVFSAVHSMKFVAVNNIVNTSLSLVCETAERTWRSRVELAVNCSLKGDCRGFVGPSRTEYDRLLCSCIYEPTQGSGRPPEVIAGLKLKYMSPFNKGKPIQ